MAKTTRTFQLSSILGIFSLIGVCSVSLAELSNNCEDLYNALLPSGRYEGSYQCKTAGSIKSSSEMEVAPGAIVTLRSPKIELVGTFKVEKGGEFAAGTPWAEQLNPDLPGRLLFSHDWNNHTSVTDDRLDGGLLMDIASGTTIRIPNTHWAELFEARGYPNAKRNTALPVHGSNSVFLAQSKGDCGAGALEFDFCIFIQDFQGSILDFYHVAYGTYDHIQMSHDQRYLAIFTDDGRLRLFERTDGLLHQIDNYDYTSAYRTPFVWKPDNRLIVVSHDGRHFIFTHANSAQPDYALVLPESMKGRVTELALSPSGQRFTFILRGEDDNESPWVVNTDGTSLRLLATSADGGGIEHFGQLQWSPDGQYILLKEPYVGDFSGGSSGLPPPSIYVIPSQDQGVLYRTAEDPDQRSPEVVRLKFWCDNPEEQECLYRYRVPAQIYWIQ